MRRKDDMDMSEIALRDEARQFLSMLKNSASDFSREGRVFDIYEIGIIEELVEDDELSAEEEGFMTGYLEA